MKKIIHLISRIMAMATVMSMLFAPMMAREAMAQAGMTPAECAGAGGSCLEGECVSEADGSIIAACAPEMSDYLAMAFVAVAGGMIFHFRRRALARA